MVSKKTHKKQLGIIWMPKIGVFQKKHIYQKKLKDTSAELTEFISPKKKIPEMKKQNYSIFEG